MKRSIKEIREMWIELQIEIIQHNIRNNLPINSMYLHLTPTISQQGSNGLLRYNYME